MAAEPDRGAGRRGHRAGGGGRAAGHPAGGGAAPARPAGPGLAAVVSAYAGTAPAELVLVHPAGAPPETVAAESRRPRRWPRRAGGAGARRRGRRDGRRRRPRRGALRDRGHRPRAPAGTRVTRAVARCSTPSWASSRGRVGAGTAVAAAGGPSAHRGAIAPTLVDVLVRPGRGACGRARPGGRRRPGAARRRLARTPGLAELVDAAGIRRGARRRAPGGGRRARGAARLAGRGGCRSPIHRAACCRHLRPARPSCAAGSVRRWWRWRSRRRCWPSASCCRARRPPTAAAADGAGIVQYGYRAALPEGWTHTGGRPERRRTLLTPSGCAAGQRPGRDRGVAAGLRPGGRTRARRPRAAGRLRRGRRGRSRAERLRPGCVVRRPRGDRVPAAASPTGSSWTGTCCSSATPSSRWAASTRRRARRRWRRPAPRSSERCTVADRGPVPWAEREKRSHLHTTSPERPR